MIDIIDKTKCCGCNACGGICAYGAITFKTDIKGFWCPAVNKGKCVDCGLYEKVCPIINIKELKESDLSQPVYYTAEHKNMEAVFDSTSGGLFSVLADIMYKDRGYVGGAVSNEDFSIRQYISDNKTDLPRIGSSKYLQGSFEGFFVQVRRLLCAGEKVLVCGSPCQVAALRAFLCKDYDNLTVVDYICRGINSPKVWRKYLDSFEERYGSKVIYCKAKLKEYGWRNLTQKVILANGKHVYETKDQSNYTKGYLQTGVYCRPSYYECKFKGCPRIADITPAGFWGIEEINTSMGEDLGTSLVMINSKKGKAHSERTKQHINYPGVPFSLAEKSNPVLNQPLGASLVNRNQFFKDLDRMTSIELANKYILPCKQGKKRFVKDRLGYICTIMKTTQMRPRPLWQLLEYNTIGETFRGNILLPAPYCIIHVSKTTTIREQGITFLGQKVGFRKSKFETRLSVDAGTTLNLGPGAIIGYDSDIEVFSGATLTFKGHGGSNIELTVVCSEHIEFGDRVMIGRNVTVRDDNGSHHINRQGYKNTKPVIIGDKAWLCESCTTMNGVRVGDGVIIGTKSFVISNVPVHAMVSEHPAQIADEDILWKY